MDSHYYGLQIAVPRVSAITGVDCIPDVCSLESYVDDSKLNLSFPVAEASNMIQQINNDFKKSQAGPVMTAFSQTQRKPSCWCWAHVRCFRRPSPSAQDLGLQVDRTLSYDEHVTQTVSSCIGSLCQINRVKHLFDARTLERVINALVFSKLYYCSPV